MAFFEAGKGGRGGRVSVVRVGVEHKKGGTLVENTNTAT